MAEEDPKVEQLEAEVCRNVEPSWFSLKRTNYSYFVICFRDQDSDDEPETSNQKVEDNIDEVGLFLQFSMYACKC